MYRARGSSQVILKLTFVCFVFIQLQLQEEEKLAKQQTETLKVHYKKFKMIDDIIADGTARRLARKYDLGVTDD